MTTPFVGMICPFGFTFAPLDWAQCNGQTLSISQYNVLFAVIGNQFGGNGQTTFNLPNLMNNAMMGSGQGPGLSNRTIGQLVGSASVTLTTNQMPGHMHTLFAATSTNSAQAVATPTNTAQLGISTPGKAYSKTTAPQVAFSPKAIGIAGQNQPHNNVSPVNTLNVCISLSGIFPSRN